MRERYIDGRHEYSLIKTANGLTITVKHTVSTPHPYDRINQIAGTKGIFQDYPPRIYMDGQNADESWEPVENSPQSKWKQYEYPLWTTGRRRRPKERRSRRDGLHHDLSAAAMRARRPAAGYGCV